MKNKPDKKTKLSKKRIEKLVDTSVDIETLNAMHKKMEGMTGLSGSIFSRMKEARDSIEIIKMEDYLKGHSDV